ncbi:MAG: hypothetical protein K2H78_00695, partial [Clostridia bacterium]|nr:hypothetical protein [Clostridia bacterium]
CGTVWDNATTNDQTTKSVSFTINPKVLTAPSGTVTTDYSGGDQSLKTITNKPAWYDQTVYTDPTILTVSPATVKAANETGHTVTVTLASSNYAWSDKGSNASAARTFTFKVNRQALDIEFEEKDGLQVAKYKDDTQIFTSDKDGAGKPTFTLKTKYYEAGTSPNGAVDAPTGLGNWVAMAVLDGTGADNYKVDATKAFTATKKSVAYPTLSTSSSNSEEYDGTSQEFTYTGFDSTIMNAPAVPTGADSFDGTTLKATNAGKYTPVFTLKDTTMYDWSGTAPGAVEITPKPVVINSDSANETDWEKGTATTLTFNVPTQLCNGDTTVNLVATYTLNGGDAQSCAVAVNGTTGTVTIGKGFAKGNYVLTVKVADGENYSGTCTHNFEITAKGLSLGNNDIKWNIDGKSYVTADYDNGNAVYEMEYTGKPLTLQNVSVNFSSASDAPYLEQDGDLTGTFIGAVDVDTYTATFKVKPKSNEETCSDGPFTLTIKIVPKKLDFSKAEWEYSDSTDDDGNPVWKQLNASSKPSYTGNAVSIRISPSYMKGLGLDIDNGDYTETYTPLNDSTEQGQKTTNVGLTINNANYTTADESGYESISYNWEITARTLSYSWTTQAVNVGDNAFEFPAVAFADGTDYSQYYDYIYTVDGDSATEYTLEELKAYIADNWSETTPVSGTVRVQMKNGVTEVNINSGSRPFSTGTPKTALSVAVSGSGAEYGNVSFAVSVVRGTADESRRTSVTITGDTLVEAQTFDGDDTELVKFVNKLGAGSYTITVSLKAGNEDSYVLSQREFEFEISKCNVLLPTVREIVFTGETIYLVDYLDGFDATLMKLIGAAEGENGIVSGRDYRKSGYFTTIALIDGANYQFVKAAESSEAETVKVTLKFAVAFADGDEVLGSEYEYNWMINRFRITEDMWDKSGKNGASLKLPSLFAAIVADKNLLDISYAYYEDQNGAALEAIDFKGKGGNSFWVNATLTGEEANNFEFENGLQISDRTVYTVPQSKTEAFFNNAKQFVQKNMTLVICCAVGLLLLILLIIIIACAARSRKKKREREELAEQRRLEREEREREERKLEREERMARLSQVQAAAPAPQYIPQPIPQYAPQPQYMPQSMPQNAQPMGMGGSMGGGSITEAMFMQMQAEFAAMKAEQAAKELAEIKAEQAAIKAEQNAMRNDFVMDKSGAKAQAAGISVDAMTEIMTMALKNVLASATQQVVAAQPAQPAQLTDGGTAATPAATQVPPDAVMTTVTTTKIDTTKKAAQTTDRAAAPAGRTIVRNYVAPMPVDDGRVFDVGGFYTPADPVTDMGIGEEEKKD